MVTDTFRNHKRETERETEGERERFFFCVGWVYFVIPCWIWSHETTFIEEYLSTHKFSRFSCRITAWMCFPHDRLRVSCLRITACLFVIVNKSPASFMCYANSVTMSTASYRPCITQYQRRAVTQLNPPRNVLNVMFWQNNSEAFYLLTIRGRQRSKEEKLSISGGVE